MGQHCPFLQVDKVADAVMSALGVQSICRRHAATCGCPELHGMTLLRPDRSNSIVVCTHEVENNVCVVHNVSPTII